MAKKTRVLGFDFRKLDQVGTQESRKIDAENNVFFSNFEWPFTPPIGVKLWENAFQTIPDIQFFNAQINFEAIFFLFSKHFRVDFFQESCVLEEPWLFGRDGQMRLDK